MSKKSDKIIKSLMDILKKEKIIIKRANLPVIVKAFIMKNDDKVIIVLNNLLKRNITAFTHELLHIYFNDQESLECVDKIEHRAHYYTKYIKKRLNTNAKRLFSTYIKESELVKV